MRRSRRHREQLVVSLFPFLAVLICTLGVLIIMLVMAAKNADVEARQVHEDDQEKQLAKVALLDASLNTKLVQVEGLGLVRPEATQRLQGIRNHRGYLENEIRKLDEQAVQLASQLKLLDQEMAQQGVPVASETEIVSLESQISRASQQLDSVRQASAEFQPATYSILPQATPGGTNRRPIYLECDGNGVTIQPFGVLLTSSSFVEPVVTGNPLDAALLTIREYWRRYDLAGTAGNPYPLMVIRPSGANSYVVARRAMTSWDDEFGYELLEEDKKLDFGEVDEQLKSEINSAIENAQRRQQRRAAIVMERRAIMRESFNGRSARQPGLVASGPQGGFVPAGANVHGVPRDSVRPYSKGGQDSNDGQAGRFANSGRQSDQRPFDSVLDQYRNNKSRGGSRSTAIAQSAQQKHSTRPIVDSHQSSTSQSSTSQSSTSQVSTSQTKGSGGDSKIYSPNQSIANERGQGWALPSKTPGATGYLRPIRIYCAANQLGVRTAVDHVVSIPMNGSTEEAVEGLIESVWQLIDSWGSAGTNGYWKPQLRMTVQPGGRRRFEQLQALLDQSGLEIKELAP